MIALDDAGARAEVVRGILGVDPELDGVAGEPDVGLADAEWLAGRDAQLHRHEVDAGQALGDGMLDLDPAVDLDEVEVAGAIDQELERADVLVAGRDDRPDRPFGQVGSGGSDSAGVGASSRIFWWRRWTEQSRSPRWTPWPYRSTATWTSTWRFSSSHFSRYRESSPNAAFASLRQTLSTDSSSRDVRTMRMPLPPPPADGLTRTG